MRLIEFYRNENGFLGQLIGASLGKLIGGGTGKAIATAIGGAIGKKADERSGQRKEDERYSDSYVRMAEAAKKAGLNPLEVLRAGDPAATGPRIMSSAAASNSFDQIDRILSGQAAADRASQKLRDELMRVDIDRARTGAFGSPSINVFNTAPRNRDGTYDVTRPVGYAGAELAPRQHVVTATGDTVQVTEGQDFGEAIMGKVYDEEAIGRDVSDRAHLSAMAGEKYIAQASDRLDAEGRIVEWDDAFGAVKPVWWDYETTSNEKRLNWIYAQNRIPPKRRQPFFGDMRLAQ
jgi:hypothetical protein